ncbi:hypothetical protein HFD88_007998 [Aspergillus terreus]|nr:hypothetical protein HFD88_007998 [Aspergillus terreus]
MQYQSSSLWATPPPSTNDIHHLAHLDARLPDRVSLKPASGQRHLPSGKERDDAANSPSQGRRQSPNQPDYKVSATAAPVSTLLDWPVWGDELTVTVEMREEESRDITPPGIQRLWVFLNNEESAHHAAGYIRTSADDPLAKHIVARGLLTQVDAPDVFQSVLQHVEQCMSGHEHCKATAHINPLPTRVVDCTNPLKPKLWATDGKEGKYIALSYVWGEPQAHSTTQDRLEMYQGEIELSALPQTIRDAIRVTHSLGYRFLWIDSLCILQDSDEDKRNEIGNMRSIYSDASLVIIAASAKRVGDGFLQTRVSNVSEANDTPLAFQLPGGRIGSLHLSTNGKFSGYDPSMEPVNARGWCFQEHMLATRALVFASHTLQYHCRTNGVRNIGNSYNYSPDETAGRIPGRIFSMAESMRTQGSSIQPPARTSLSAEEWKSTRKAWFVALRNYTQRSVSHPADKLIAFAAIAETFHALWSETRYLAGLWEDTLLEDLLWKKPKPPLPRPEAYRAPSWSWASVNGETNLDVIDDMMRRPGEDAVKSRCEILSSDVTLADPALSFGAVTGGTLVLRAALVPALLAPFFSEIASEIQVHARSVVGQAGSSTEHESTADSENPNTGMVTIGTFWPDSSDDARLGEVWAVPMMWKKPNIMCGLIVVPANEDGDAVRYRRVGLFTHGVVHANRNAVGIDWIDRQDTVEIVIE